MDNVQVPEHWLPLFEWHQKWHYKQQLDLIEALRDYWEVVFCAGNGTGKTHLLYWNCICYALGIHPYQIAPPPIKIKVLVNDFEHGYGQIFKPTVLEQQYMPDNTVVKPMLSDKDIKTYPSRDNRTMVFNNGSIMFFQTSVQPKKLHSGTNFDILGCDEEPDYQVYDESKRGLRTARGGGKILHSFTPPFDEEEKQRGPSWTKFKLIDPFEQGEDDDISVIKSAMMDNPAVTDDFIRKFSKGKTEEQLRIQLYGEYPTWGEMVFPFYQDTMWDPKIKQGHVLPFDFDVPFSDSEWSFEMAVDWHGSKPSACIWTMEKMTGENKGDIIVWDEISPQMAKNKTIMEFCQMIREVEGWREVRFKRWGDPKMKDKNNALISGFNAWEEFRHCGIRLSEGWNRQPEVGISIINDFLRGKSTGNEKHPRVFIRENCRTLRHQMKNHYWDRHGSTAKPDPKFSDYPICLRYIMQSKSRKIKKNMEKKGRKKWDLTSYGGNPYGPYKGTYIERRT